MTKFKIALAAAAVAALSKPLGFDDAEYNTNVGDVIVPEVFTPYVQQLTEQKSRIIQSGLAERSAQIDALLAGGGLTFSVPSWRDLDNDAENVSGDETADTFKHTLNANAVEVVTATWGALTDSRPKATDSDLEVAVRLSRNQSWASADLAAALAGNDPAGSIAERVAYYWTRRQQAALIATIQGVCKDNGTNDSGDYSNDIAGSAFTDGVTNFSAEAFLNACLTMGDSMEDLVAVMVHSVVFNRMQRNNLIDFIPDATGQIMIPTFLGREVIVDDGMPFGSNAVRGNGVAATGNVYETWLFGRGAIQLGVGSAKVPTEVQRQPQAGNGGGQEVLYSRQEWCFHPRGHAYVGTPGNGGPSNGTGSNQLNNAGSWNRVFPERKMIKFARLITREA